LPLSDLGPALFESGTIGVQTLDKYVTAFQKLSAPFFQERVYDVKDVFRRVLWHLQPFARKEESDGQRLVLLAREPGEG